MKITSSQLKQIIKEEILMMKEGLSHSGSLKRRSKINEKRLFENSASGDIRDTAEALTDACVAFASDSMNPAAMKQARQSAVASTAGMRMDPTRIMGTPQRAVSARPNPGSARQYARKPAAAGAGPGPVDNVVKQADVAGKQGLLKGKGKGLAIGAGAAVIAGLAYSGRRGEGSSGGRTGMTRY